MDGSEISEGVHPLKRRVTRADAVVVLVSAAVGLLAMLGFKVDVTPRVLTDRVAAVEKRVDSLRGELFLTNYIQCVQLRESRPELVPPGCTPVLAKKAPGAE